MNWRLGRVLFLCCCLTLVLSNSRNQNGKKPTTTKATPSKKQKPQKNNGPQNPCDGVSADIVFVLDQSAQVNTKARFDRQIDFVKAIVQKFDFAGGRTHIGAITFSSAATIHFNLDKADKAKIVEALDNLKIKSNLDGDSNTFDAITQMRTKMFADTHDRPNIPNIGIVITHGPSDDTEKTKEEAKAARNANITMIAVGVGEVQNGEELGSIANSSKYVFKVQRYSDKETTENTAMKLAQAACEAAKEGPLAGHTKVSAVAGVIVLLMLVLVLVVACLVCRKRKTWPWGDSEAETENTKETNVETASV